MSNLSGKAIKVRNTNIHYFTGGAGEPLVIIHGGGGSQPWLNRAQELSGNYTVYVPDLPGFGRSERASEKFNLSEYVNFVEDFMLGLGIERFHLVGHSIGGCIALHYAFKFPQKVNRLVLVSSFCLGKEVALWVRVLSSVFFRKILGKSTVAIWKAIKWLVIPFYAPFAFVDLVSRLKIDIGKTITKLKGQTIILRSQLSELLIPTLLIWGAKDGIVPASHAYAAVQIIPDCQLKIFENCGHNVHNRESKEFSRLMKQFLG